MVGEADLTSNGAGKLSHSPLMINRTGVPGFYGGL
jgi:hypothetical protein